MSVRIAVIFLAFSCIAGATVHVDEKPWVELQSPHFRVMTNGSEGDARKVALEFEQLRNVFAAQFPSFRLNTGVPLLILAVRDEETAKALDPAQWKKRQLAGVFYVGWEKQYVMLRLDAYGPGAREVVYHEYAHSILHNNTRWLPVWLDEGLAELFAYTRPHAHDTDIGAPTERYSTLASRTPIPVETLIGVDARSRYYHDADKVDLFYAESWALVHFMLFGQGMDHGSHFNQFFALLQNGTEQKKAFQEVFGDFPDVDKALDQYMRRISFASMRISNPPQIEPKSFLSRVLPPAETDAELGGFCLSRGNAEAAQPLIENALNREPRLARAHEAMAFLHFAAGRDADARSEFSQATLLDPARYLSLYYKTMLSPAANLATTADQNEFDAAMMAVLELHEDFAPAYIQLARLAVQRNDLRKAFGLSRRAEELQPSLAGYHLNTGEILRRMGKASDAAAFARYVSERWRGADHNEAVELWSRLPSEQKTGSPILEEIPKDASTAVGTVKVVECTDKDRRNLLLLRDGHTLTFRFTKSSSGGFSDTIWYGPDHFQVCHHLENMRAVIRYSPSADASYTGDVVEYEIRNDAGTISLSNTNQEKSSRQ